MPGDGKKDKNPGNKKLNTADLLRNLRQQSNIAFGNDYDIEDDEYEEENDNIIEEEEPENDNQLNINNINNINNNVNEDDDADQMEEEFSESSYVEDAQKDSNSEGNNNNDEEVPVDELENDGENEPEDDLDNPHKGRIVKEETEIIIETRDKEQAEKEREEFEKSTQDLINKIKEDEKVNANKYDVKPKDLTGTLFDFDKKAEPSPEEKVEEIFKNIDDNLKNVLGDNIIDIDDIEDEPEISDEKNEIVENKGNIEDIETGTDINSLEIDEPEQEPELIDLRTDLQKAESKVNEWLYDEDEPEIDANKKDEPAKEKDENKLQSEEIAGKEDVHQKETNPEKEEPADNLNESIEKKTDEITKKVDELVSQPFSDKKEPEKDAEPEKQGPKPEDLADNGQVRGAFVPENGEKMLPKQQLNHLSDMIDDINKANGTAFSSRGINKYLSNQFKHGEGESLEEQRNSFKGSYTSFCKEAYKNMLDKRSKMPFDKRPSLEQSLADFQKFTKQVENLAKANGWMHSEVEMGPFGGLEPSEIKKMQKESVDKEPKNTYDAVRNQIAGKPSSKDLKEFSDKFKDKVNSVPQADKESSVQGPEAAQTISELKALNDVHNSRGIGYRLRHPILYRRESKLLDSSMKALEEKGYDREVINQMLKEKDLQDPAKEAHEKDVKSISDIEKKTSKQTRDFAERKEKEDYLARKNIKGMRKQISVPEADNSKDLVNVPKEMKSPAVSKKLEVQKTNQMQMGGNK